MTNAKITENQYNPSRRLGIKVPTTNVSLHPYADMHLDSPLKSLALKDQQAGEIVESATRQCFINIINLCMEGNVDTLIIAGDLYEGELRSMKTAELFTFEMHRLVAVGVKVFIARGNHDAVSKITKELQLPDGVHVFSKKGSSILE